MNSYCFKNRHILYVVAALTAVFLLIPAVFAQTDDQFKSAFNDLSETTGQTVDNKEQAVAVCDQEKYFEVCASVGKEHSLYQPEELKQVDAFVNEIKGAVSQQLQSCQTTECLISVANELAKKLSTKDKTLATNFDLVSGVIDKKQALVTAAKDLGVSFDDCRNMDPDTASLELLRTCAKLAKDTRVQTSIPENVRDYADKFSDQTIDLRESLAKGEYQCGDGTLEGCGNFCLNPSETARVQGTSGVPQVCKQIATKFFGADGVKQLEAAYTQVGQAKDFYNKKAANVVFTTIDGKTLAKLEDVGKYMEEQGRKGNVAAVEKGMDFMISQGFITEKDKEFALSFVKKVGEKGGIQNFDQCVTNPQACQDFVPDDRRGDFEDFQKIESVMRQELGFDPQQCEGSSDPSVGQKCVEGAKKALAKLESLNIRSEGARQVLQEIKSHVSRGEEFINRKDQFQQVFQQQGGPGGCKSEGECRLYCSDSSHGPECIAFGSSQGISGFQGQEAVQRFQDFNQSIQAPQYQNYSGFPGQGAYPGFQPPGQGGFVPGQYPGFTQPGPGFGPPPGYGGYPGGPGPGFGPVGPSPECFAAIQSGDFVKAKSACTVNSVGPNPVISGQPYPTRVICPAVAYVECPAGQYHKTEYTGGGCVIDRCEPYPSYSSGPYPSYSIQPYQPYPSGPYPSYTPGGKPQCSDGIDNDNDGPVDYPSDPSCYGPDDWDEYYPTGGPAPSCPSGQWWDYTQNKCSSIGPYPSPSAGKCPSEFAHDMGGYCMLSDDTTKCADYSVAGSKANYSSDCSKFTSTTSYSPYPTGGTYTPAPSCPSGQWWDYGRNACVSSTVSPYPTSTGSSSCSQSLINLLGTGCHWMSSDLSGRGIYCDGAMTKSAKEGDTSTTAGCTSGTTTYSPYPTYTPGSSYTPAPSCPSGQWWSYTTNSCQSSTSSGSCPTGSHSMGTYCMSDSDSTKCGPSNSTSTSGFGSCSSYQGTTTYSPYPSGSSYTYTPAPSGAYTYSPYPSTSTTSCPAGQWYDAANHYCRTDCASGTFWDPAASKCVSSTGTTYTPYPTYTYTYTPTPSCPSGQWWDSATSTCKSTTTTYTPYPTYTSTYTYTPYPTYEYPTPSTTTYTPYPTTEYPTPASYQTPPTSSVQHQMALASTIMNCSDGGGKWNGSTCSRGGSLFGSIISNVLKLMTGGLVR